MNLTWHIVLKDFRRLRLPIAAWMLSFVIQFILGARLMSGAASTVSSFQSAQTSCQILSLIQFVVGFMLIPEVILDDPLVGTSAFWPTRPISGARLLGAKVLACALLFGLLPNLVSLPWWLYCGYDAHQVWSAAAGFLVFELAPLALGLLVASLSASLSRFIGWSILLSIGLALSFVELVTPAATHLFLHGMDLTVGAEVNRARLLQFCWIAYPAAALVIAHQFLTRRIARSLVLLSFILALLAVDVTWWPLGPTAHPRTPGIAASLPELDSRVVLRCAEGPMLHQEGDSSDKSDGFLFGVVAVEGVLPERLLRFDPPVLESTWPDGTSARTEGRFLRMSGWAQPGPYQAESVVPHKERSESAWENTPLYGHLLKEGRQKTWDEIYKKSPANHPWDYYFEVSRSVGTRMLAEPSTSSIELRGSFLEPKLSAEVLMEKGKGWSGGSEGFRIASCGWNERARMYEAFLVEHRAAIDDAPQLPIGTSSPPDATYVAINRAKGESAVAFRGANYGVPIRIATVEIAWHNVEFNGPQSETMGLEWQDGHWTGPDLKDWFSGLTLGRVTESVQGGFSRKIPMEKYTATLDMFSKAP